MTQRVSNHPTSTPARVVSELGGLVIGSGLGLLAALRRGKAVHPDGVVHAGQLKVEGAKATPAGSSLLAEPGTHACVVRFSRSVGLPRPVPDLLGIAIRVLEAYGPGAHQDFMLVSSGDLPVVRHLFLPSKDFQARPYTSSLPYEAGSERFLIGLLPRDSSPRPGGADEFARLAAAAATGDLEFDLSVSRGSGKFQPVGRLQIGRPLERDLDSLRFDTLNTNGGLRPAGVINAMRPRAYRLSQAAWRRTQPDAARAQDAADAAIVSLSDAGRSRARRR
jgi:hypothetical protein